MQHSFCLVSIVLAKKMLLVSHKMFIENKAALLCKTIQVSVRVFATTIQHITFLLRLLLSQISIFVVHFSNTFWYGNETFPSGSSQNEILLLLIMLHLPLVPYSCCSCRTHDARVSFVLRWCRTRVTLVSLWSGTRVVKQTRSFLITRNSIKVIKSINLEANFHKALVCKSLTILTDVRFYMLDRIFFL